MMRTARCEGAGSGRIRTNGAGDVAAPVTGAAVTPPALGGDSSTPPGSVRVRSGALGSGVPGADASSTIVGETTSRVVRDRPAMSQRWRLSVSRGTGAAHVQHRELTPIWEAILAQVAAAAAA